jgi:osmoprotectant transport system permease protein
MSAPTTTITSNVEAGAASINWVPHALRIVGLGLLVAFLIQPQWFEPVFRPLAPANAPAIYTQADLLVLTGQHLRTVLIATVLASLLAITLAIIVTRPSCREFLPLSRLVVNTGQTFPPVAVLALAVPMLGFGETPTLVALFLYALLPIFESTLTGLANVPEVTREAARGTGMTPWQSLMKVELPLALPVILSGVRIAVVISLATATIGSTVAAKTLGEVIIAGLQSSNMAFILQGGLVVGLLAVFVYDGMIALEKLVTRWQHVSRSR